MSNVTLGGRQFAALNLERRTVRWQLHVDRVIGDTGLDRILPAAQEEPQAYLLRLHTAVMRSGRACELLGCFLLPMGKGEADWTPEMAQETANWIEGLDTEEDVQEVYRLGLDFVLGFFGRQLRSLASSLISSSEAGKRSQPHAQPAH